jgi:hypothetical protein
MLSSHTTQCHPLPRNDLISGRDFLSLFIDNEAETENFPKRNAKSLRRIFHTYRHDNQAADSVLPIEAIFSEELTGESSTYYHDSSFKRNSNSRKQKKEILSDEVATKVDRETIDLGMMTSTTSRRPETSSNIPSTQDVESSKRHIQLVTTGSKIIFFEDEQPVGGEVSTEASRVISVRVSSSVATGRQPVERAEQKTTALPLTTELATAETVGTSSTSTSTTLPNFVADIAYETGGQPISDASVSDLSFIEDVAHETGGQLISNSHKSEFSIEEDDSYTRTKDSMNGESSTVHKIVAAPLTFAPPHQPRSRMQRKQDAIVPYQTIIYHDDPGKDGSDAIDAKLKPISYSSTGHTGGELQTWKDIDTYLRNKTVGKGEMEMSATSMSAQFSQPEKVYSEPAKVYSEPAKFYSEPSKVYSEPSKFYSEPSKVYSEPAKVYGEPAKVYSEPEKVYGVPAKVYSEPARVYSEPAKNYGLPAKVYSKPSQVWSQPPTTPVPMESRRQVIHNLDKLPYDELNAPAEEQHSAKRLMDTIGRFAPKPADATVEQPMMQMAGGGVTTTLRPNNGTQPPVDDTKVGYVVEGENYRKYRVEEKTPDGFIVGEYGVLSHNDGSLRGVRYTADSNINPRLIHDALVKFLSL